MVKMTLLGKVIVRNGSFQPIVRMTLELAPWKGSTWFSWEEEMKRLVCYNCDQTTP